MRSSFSPRATAPPARNSPAGRSRAGVTGLLVGVVALMACASQKPTVGANVRARGLPSDPRTLVFERNRCHECHGVAALGIVARDSTAPDLSLAAVRVPRQYGLSLARFLEEPTGTMAVVLDLEIRLSPADRDTIIATLESLARNQRQ